MRILFCKVNRMPQQNRTYWRNKKTRYTTKYQNEQQRNKTVKSANNDAFLSWITNASEDAQPSPRAHSTNKRYCRARGFRERSTDATESDLNQSAGELPATSLLKGGDMQAFNSSTFSPFPWRFHICNYNN